MGIEIERKYLVRQEHLPDLGATAATYIRQGYLSMVPVVRVRVSEKNVLYTEDVSSLGKGPRSGELTIKGPGLMERQEFNHPISVEDAEGEYLLAKWIVRKFRYKIRHAGFTWDLDHFCPEHKNLWLAEIELPTPTTKFASPAWVGAEVTDDPAYQNTALAVAR